MRSPLELPWVTQPTGTWDRHRLGPAISGAVGKLGQVKLQSSSEATGNRGPPRRAAQAVAPRHQRRNTSEQWTIVKTYVEIYVSVEIYIKILNEHRI